MEEEELLFDDDELVTAEEAAQAAAQQGTAPLLGTGTEEDNTDIYADLIPTGDEGDPVLLARLAELQDRVRQQQSTIAKLQEAVGDLRSQRDKLEGERDILVRNISCLFLTARLELQRKQDDIQALRSQVSATIPAQ